MSNKLLLQQAIKNRIGHNVPFNVRVKLESLKECNVEFNSIGNTWCSHIDVTFSTIYPADEKSSPLNQAADFLSNIDFVPKENIAGHEEELESVSGLFKGYVRELRELPCTVRNVSYSDLNTRVSIAIFEPPVTNITDIVTGLNLPALPDSAYVRRKFNCKVEFELTGKALAEGYALTSNDGKLFSVSTLVNDYGHGNSLSNLILKLDYLRGLCVVNVNEDDALDGTDPLLIDFHRALTDLCSEERHDCRQLVINTGYFELRMNEVPF